MKPHLVAAVAIGATAVLLTTAGCGDKPSSSTASSSSSSAASTSKSASATTSAAAAAADYSQLLIAAEDIVAPGDTFTAQEPTVNPGGKDGVATVFTNAEDTHEIGDTIFVLPDAAAADTSLQGAIAAFDSSVVGGTPETVPVGTSATMVSGTSPDGAKAVTVLVFTQGTAFTTLEFDSSSPDDPVPPDFVVDVAQKQADKLKAGLG